MSLKWTKNKPTVAGWYFAKCIGRLSGNKFISVVKVYRTNDTNGPTLVFFDGENFGLDDDCFVEWSDKPIELPTESNAP